MTDPLVAVVVTVPEEHFSDDEICSAAGHFVCTQLETHLVQHGHSVPDWIRGGCAEDWGIYFESKLNETSFDYSIGVVQGPQDTTPIQALIQYGVQVPFFKSLFRKPVDLPTDHPIHETMRSFGKLLSPSRMLTQSQLEAEY